MLKCAAGLGGLWRQQIFIPGSECSLDAPCMTGDPSSNVGFKPNRTVLLCLRMVRWSVMISNRAPRGDPTYIINNSSFSSIPTPADRNVDLDIFRHSWLKQGFILYINAYNLIFFPLPIFLFGLLPKFSDDYLITSQIISYKSFLEK